MSDRTYRVVLYSPDRGQVYDGRTLDATGVGGGIAARLSMLGALAALGHEVTAYVNAAEPVVHAGVRYVPLDQCAGIDADVLIAMSTGGDLSFAPLELLPVNAALRVVWVQGVPKPAALEATRFDYVYAASNFLRRVSVERWGVPASKMFVCYNGLNQEAFAIADAQAFARDPYALAYVGPPEKGLDATLEILRRLRAEDPRFHLEVFGGGRLWGGGDEAPAAEPGLTFHGLLGQRALIPRLYGCEYLLAPQAMEEGFGIAVQEAKRAGLIVIASDVGAFGELVRSSQDGFLVAEPHTSAACHQRMAGLVLSLSHDPDRRARIRANAKHTPWSWATAAEAWTAHWDHVSRRAGALSGSAPRATIAVGGLLDLPDGQHEEATGEYFPARYPFSSVLDARRPSQRVLIAGYYGHHNLGDEAILHVLLEELRRAVPNLQATVVSGAPDVTGTSYDVTAIYERDVPSIVDAVQASDLVIVGGGGLFHDYQGVDEATLLSRWQWGLTYFAGFPLLASLYSKPLLMAAVGVGPLRSDAGRRYTRLAFDRADEATVRDADSRAQLTEIGADVSRVAVAADPAWLINPPPQRDRRTALARLGVPAGARVIAIALRDWDVGVAPDAWQEEVALALDTAIDVAGVVPVFIPFQSPAEQGLADDAVADRVRRLMRNGPRAVMAPPGLDPHQVQALIAGADLVLAMRLHAVILAGNASVPVVALAYDPKVGAAMARLDVGEFTVGLADATAAGIADRIAAADRERARIQARMEHARRGLRDAAMETVAKAMDLLANRGRPVRAPSAELTQVFNLTYAAQVRRAEVNDAHVVRLTADLAAEAREVERASAEAARASAEADRATADADRATAEASRAVAEAANVAADLAGVRDTLKHAEEAAREAERAFLAAEEAQRAELDRARGDAERLKTDLARGTTALATASARLLEVASAPGGNEALVEETNRRLALLTRRLEEQTDRADRLDMTLSRMARTKVWRLAGLYWRARAALGARLRRAGLRPRRRQSRLLMNPYEYVFDRFKRERTAAVGAHLGGLRTPGQPGLVSVILPAYNGADLIREAIDSVLAQSYPTLELIIVNDGSTDETPRIADAYAARDARVRVVHQANQKLPRALSAGVKRARGEYVTWTSCDNRLKPDCLARLVADLAARPACDMIYANLDIIDGQGRFMRGAPQYDGYQRPPGSEHVHLPPVTAELNIWPNNYVGAAFLYRRRAAWLLGDYSPFRFVAEDYDYWMRVNALLTLRHAGFDAPVYDYRFHNESLTARWDELGMLQKRERLMVFEEFRRDFCLSPLFWVIDGDDAELTTMLERRLKQAGHLVYRRQFPLDQLPRLWVPVVHVRATATPAAPGDSRHDLPPSTLSVVATRTTSLPPSMPEAWQMCIAVGGSDALPELPLFAQGWLGASDVATAFQAIDVRARSHHLAQIEALVESTPPPALKASVVICTHRFNERVIAAITSALEQSAPPDWYEVLIVNNAPGRPELSRAVQGLRDAHRRDRPDRVRLVACPVLGLSAARNAGIAEARGEIVCLLDDDAVAEPEWLSRLVAAFDAHPDAGVIGGHIRLKVPASRPAALKPGWEKYWSQFLTGFSGYSEVKHWWEFPWGANWSARRSALLAAGGFRLRYGRVGDNFWGGEEVIASALIQRLGYHIAVLPEAAVVHDVEPARFTRRHVQRTLVAGHCVAWLGQRDLYLPMESGLRTTLKLIAGQYVDPTIPGRADRVVDAAYRKYAQLRLLALQLGDIRRRMRRPLVATDPPRTP
jgi:polysaccharide pyruvyl transferase CsaB